MVHDSLKYPGAWAPMAMSLAALCVVAVHLLCVGTARATDEGAAAHLFQLLMAGQVPIVAFFAIRWLGRAPRRALAVLGLQVLFAVVACMPVLYFHL